MNLNTKNILSSSNVVFGTSGARGLVTDFTPQVCAAYTHAFISVTKRKFSFDTVALGIDNRPSSEAMAQAIAGAIESIGLKVAYYGVLPTPALAYHSMMQKIPCIMVTGSHIPFDRNGLKFYRPDGEISKADEVAINDADVEFELELPDLPMLTTDSAAVESYITRYTSLFDKPFLRGKKIGIYEHSSSGRNIYHKIFKALGAEVVALERSDEFVPIDTEAVSEEDRQKALSWSKEYGFDAIFSTDGDGDRPLLADDKGEWIRGDILGLLTAVTANLQALAVPISCNTAIEKSAFFNEVKRTKIGSPYVIAEFQNLKGVYASVAGFEANGGFILGSDIVVNGKIVKALPTRDAVFPAIMLLLAAVEQPISACVSKLPTRYTASDRVKNFATDKSNEIINTYSENANELLKRLGFSNQACDVNLTDGLRITMDNNDIVHIRPSGNAPELRCYFESEQQETALKMVKKVLEEISKF